MSKIICSAAIRGAHKIVDMAEESYEEALKKYRLFSTDHIQYARLQG
jgi:hypothetical protein